MKTSRFLLLITCVLVAPPQSVAETYLKTTTTTTTSECDFSQITAMVNEEGGGATEEERQQKIDAVEADCADTYTRYDEDKASIESEATIAEADYNATLLSLQQQYAAEFQGHSDVCEANKADVEADAIKKNWNADKKFDEMATVLGDCDTAFNNCLEDERTDIDNAKATYEAILFKLQEDSQTLSTNFEAEVGEMEDEAYAEVSPSGYEVYEELEELDKQIEKSVEKVRQEFSDGVCCDFRDTTGELMDDEELIHFQTGIRTCYNHALHANGLSGYIESVYIIDHSTALDTTSARKELRGRRKLNYDYSTSSCYNGCCGYGCGGNDPSGSGFRRLAHAGIEVKRDLEACMLDYVTRYIRRVFPHQLTTDVSCDDCGPDACPTTAIGPTELGF